MKCSRNRSGNDETSINFVPQFSIINIDKTWLSQDRARIIIIIEHEYEYEHDYELEHEYGHEQEYGHELEYEQEYEYHH